MNATLNDELADFLEKSELAQDFLKQKRADLESKRANAISARISLDAEHEAVSAQISDLKKNLTAHLRRLEDEKRQVQLEAEDELAPILIRRHALECEIQRHKNFLSLNYDKRIDQAVELFRQKMNAVLGEPVTRTVAKGPKMLSGKYAVTIFSNHAAVLDCLEYCRGAVRELESLKTDCAAYDSSRIDELIKNVPSHKELKEASALLGSQREDAQDCFTEAAVAALMRT